MVRDELSVLSAFLAVAEGRSFTRAAKQLGVSPSAWSHAIRGLEEQIGVRLLSRTTRSVAPTEAGAQFIARLGPALADVRGALDQVSGFRDRPAGRVRLVASRVAARMVLAPKLGRFAREYPDVVLDLTTTEEGRVDLVGAGFDAGIHLGEFIERDMVAVRVSNEQRAAIVGAPSYFESHAKPKSPRDLTSHTDASTFGTDPPHKELTFMKPKNTICLWFDKNALDAARFYAATFPNSEVTAVHEAPGDYPSGKAGDVLTVEFTVLGIPCLGLNGGPEFRHSEAFSFQIATDDQAETDRYWNAIVSNGGQESQCGWCKDRWGLSWQITPRALTEALAAGGAEAKRAFEAMMPMKKIDVATIEAARRG